MTTFSRRNWARLAIAGAAVLTLPRTADAQTSTPRVPNGRRFLHYDVFTDTPLTGNQLAVFLDPQGLDAAAMHAMTRETKFSECTFVFPPEQAGTDVRLRIFSPGGEMPFAGHPVIGSTFALADSGLIAPGRKEFIFGLGIGPTMVELEWKDGARVRVDDAAASHLRRDAAAQGQARRRDRPASRRRCVPIFPCRKSRAARCSASCPLVVARGRRSAEVDRRAAEVVFKEAGMTRRGLFVFSPEPGADGATVYSRMVGANEDPATGSASGPLGCYLVKHGLVPADRAGAIVSAQGVKMGRPSRIHIRIDVAGDDITRVRVGGTERAGRRRRAEELVDSNPISLMAESGSQRTWTTDGGNPASRSARTRRIRSCRDPAAGCVRRTLTGTPSRKAGTNAPHARPVPRTW